MKKIKEGALLFGASGLALLVIVAVALPSRPGTRRVEPATLELRLEEYRAELETESFLAAEYRKRADAERRRRLDEARELETIYSKREVALQAEVAGVTCWSELQECESNREKEAKFYVFRLKSAGCTDREATREAAAVERLLSEREEELLE